MSLSEQPWVDSSAIVSQCQLGGWTSVGARTVILESSLEDYSYVMNDSAIHYASIGRFCSIAAHTCINPGNHPLWRAALHHFTYRSNSYDLAPDHDEPFFAWRRGHQVILGHDVWIGHGAIILPGVVIGTGAAVGAGAVVTHDVDTFTVVAGSPARVLRRRVTADEEAALLRIGWWDWSHDQLRYALSDFRHLDIAGFIRKYEGNHGDSITHQPAG
jgi:phosphonate metabolism protein (transferase hexapeptide repeat family)